MNPPTRFDWGQMRRYWEHHEVLRARSDLDADPHELGNVCSPDAPRWLNEHLARGQEFVFDTLVEKIPGPPQNALDVGCGAARWTARLLACGWSVDGIDLQTALIERNRLRYPQARFECVALQDYETDVRYSLVCSVTVLAHIPHEEQCRAIDQIARVTSSGAHVLVLENIRHQTAHVFANSVIGWSQLFAAAGFAMRAIQRYDFNPALRAGRCVRSSVGRLVRGANDLPIGPDEYQTRTNGRTGGTLRQLLAGVERVAGVIDARLELMCIRHGSIWPPPVHAGMLFVKR